MTIKTWLSLAGLLWTLAAGAIEVGDAWSAGSIPRLPSGALTPEQLRGKVTLVNFWATWCEACKVELVEMEKQLTPHLGEAALNVAFVTLDKDPAKAVAWFKEHLAKPELMLPRLYSDAKFAIADKLGVDSFPMTLLIGRDGKVAYIQRGFQAGEGSTERLVKLTTELLAKP